MHSCTLLVISHVGCGLLFADKRIYIFRVRAIIWNFAVIGLFLAYKRIYIFWVRAIIWKFAVIPEVSN